MSSRTHKSSPSASDFIDYALEMNGAARFLLRLESQGATHTQAKISIGLSLQAAELAGKAILIALGMQLSTVRSTHGKHDVVKLLDDAASHAGKHAHPEVRRLSKFLLQAPQIDSVRFSNTINHYLTTHFARGDSARPRNYFYPDTKTFTGPMPIQAMYFIVEQIIQSANDIVKAAASPAP